MTGRVTGRPAVQLGLVVVGLALVGVLAGVVWEWIWNPVIGVVVDHQWSPGSAIGLQQEFSSTGWYVVVAVVAGLLAGLGVGLLADRVPLLTLVAVVVGSALAAWLMLVVGSALGPPDPAAAAHTADDGTRLPSDLSVSGKSPFLALPTGALLGMALVFIGLSPRAARPESSESAPEPEPAG